MAITVSGTSITFNDSTTQTTAFTGAGSSPGQSATTYTSSGSYTFTIPSGVTKIKVTVIGGGGGACGYACGATYGGNAGNTSSVSSGSQTISTISATGGLGGQPSSARATGGLGSGGTINARGGWSIASTFVGGPSYLSWPTPYDGTNNGTYGAGGSFFINYGSGGGGGGMAMTWLTGLTPGATLSVTVGAGGAAIAGATSQSGGAGVVMFEY